MIETLLTQDGLDKLHAELDHLVNVWRPAIAQRIKEARELGDLKENAEYHAAKDEQGLYEAKIRQIEDRIRTARVVEVEDTGMVGIGCTVSIVDADGVRDRYKIVGSAEADPGANRISHESPIGRALMGAVVGQTVEAALPVGSFTMTVEKIEAG